MPLSVSPSQRLRLLTIGLTLLAFWLRLPGLFANTFAPDEALFATWARMIATWQDPLLLAPAVDKPPLAFYLQALFFPLMGPVEWAARLPNFYASLLLAPLVGALARRWYGQEQTTILGTLLFVTLSPYAIQFAPTAFLDPLLLFWLTAVFVARRPGWSGLFFGLALATKVQAALFLPLLFILNRPHWGMAAWRRWLQGFLPLLILILAWDLTRTNTISLWAAQMANYGGLRLAWSWELLPRLGQWLDLGCWFFGTTALSLAFCAGLFWLLVTGSRDTEQGRVDGVIFVYGIAYLVVHWLLAIPVWDRYLLPLLPLVALLVGRMVSLLAGQDGRRVRGLGRYALPRLLLLLLALLLMGWTALGAANGRFPIGGQVAADDGAAEVAAFLAAAPYGTVLYDHWYSWQWRYHLFAKKVYVSWVPHPAALAQDLTVFGRNGQPRFIALPLDKTANPFLRAAQDAGFHLTPVTSSGTIGLYAMTEMVSERGIEFGE